MAQGPTSWAELISAAPAPVNMAIKAARRAATADRARRDVRRFITLKSFL
jgi:conjugal transfer/entry exclusion protein